MEDPHLFGMILEKHRENTLFSDVESINSEISEKTEITANENNKTEVWSTKESQKSDYHLNNFYPEKFSENIPVTINPLFDHQAAFGSDDVRGNVEV